MDDQQFTQEEVEKARRSFAVARSVVTKTESVAFFGGLVWALKMHLNDEVATAGIDQNGNVYINPEWWNNLEIAEQVSVLCHEVCHPAFRSWQRRGNREKFLWNIAHDVWINRLLELNGLNIPDKNSGAATYKLLQKWGINLEDDFLETVTTEQIYAMIEQVASEQMEKAIATAALAGDMKKGDEAGGKKKEGEGDCPGGNGEDIDWDSLVIAAIATAQEKQAGHVPGSLKRQLGMADPVVPWQQIIHQFFMRVTQGMRYSFKPPQRRHLYRGITLPHGTPAYPRVAFILDVSGSMWDFMDYMMGEIAGCQRATNASVLLLAGDTELTHEEEIEPGDPFPSEIKGWGGTTFTWAFQHIQEVTDHTLSGIIFLTDGYNFDTIPAEVYPDAETLWIILGDNERFQPPFGSKLFISYEELREATGK